MKIHRRFHNRPPTLNELAARHKAEGLEKIEENGVVYEPVTVKTILTRNPNAGLRHHWSINPYRGCQFGCTYCFARYTAGFVEITEPLEFERRIFYKHNAPDLIKRLRDRDFFGKPVALGTATDPWQPAEAKLEITRSILKALRYFPSLDLFALTKSSLIRRDADILAGLVAAGRPVSVGFSVTTLDAKLAKKMEPQAASPKERLRAMKILSDAGVYVGLMVMPIIPRLTDTDEQLGSLLEQGRAHGARFAHANVLHLRHEPKRRFMPWLAEEFPELVQEYSAVYGETAYHHETYRQAVHERFERLKLRYGYDPIEPPRPPRRNFEQLNLFPSDATR